MTMEPDGTGPRAPAPPAPPAPAPQTRTRPEPARPEPAELPAAAPPVQSREDTDAGWGEYAEPDDNERLARDRPPHWDDA